MREGVEKEEKERRQVREEGREGEIENFRGRARQTVSDAAGRARGSKTENCAIGEPDRALPMEGWGCRRTRGGLRGTGRGEGTGVVDSSQGFSCGGEQRDGGSWRGKWGTGMFVLDGRRTWESVY